MTKWSDWSLTRKVRSLEIMDEYVRKYAEFACVNYWHDEIFGMCSSSEPDEVYREIASDDNKYADALFVFYIASTTDTSWLDDAVKKLASRRS